MNFLVIPDRLNGQRILRSWFNDLRDAGIAILSGAFPVNTFTIANNQSSPADVTSAILAFANFTSGQIHAEIKRGSLVQIVLINLFYDGTNWNCEYEGIAGSDSGVTFTVTALGQLQYTSTNTSAGIMKWFFEKKISA